MEKVRVSVEGAEEVMRKLKRLDDRITKKILKKVARESLKPMVESYKRNIKKSDETFVVYKKGRVYAEILPGQLKRSVGVKFPRRYNTKSNFYASVGPRRSGAFKNPNKGGWYAGFINFGWLQVPNGAGGKTDYSGENRNFAQKSQSGAKNRVRFKFVKTLKTKVDKEIKKLKFGQRVGLK